MVRHEMASGVLLVWLAACQPVATPGVTSSSQEPVYFLVKVQNEQFVIAMTDKKAISDAMDSMADRKRLFPNGELAMGNGGFNIGYRWHLVPESVHMAEFAIELCDGLPSHIEQNLEYWVYSVKRFCPWGGRVVERLRGPPKKSAFQN